MGIVGAIKDRLGGSDGRISNFKMQGDEHQKIIEAKFDSKNFHGICRAKVYGTADGDADWQLMEGNPECLDALKRESAEHIRNLRNKQ